MQHARLPGVITTPPTLKIPLHTDDHGAIRVGGSRVTLDSIIHFYQLGESPEDLHEGFLTVPLTDIYAMIAYYLANRVDVDAYLQRRLQEGERLRQEAEASYTPKQKAFHKRVQKLAEEKRRSQSE